MKLINQSEDVMRYQGKQGIKMYCDNCSALAQHDYEIVSDRGRQLARFILCGMCWLKLRDVLRLEWLI